MTTVHVVVPEGIDDPERPSGGNVYDRHLCRELTAMGWTVREYAARGAWPAPAPVDRAALAEVLAAIPAGELVMLDGLVACTVPEVLVPEARRLQLVVLVHMPLEGMAGDDEAGTRERAVLSAVDAVVTPSAWARRELLDRHSLRPDRVHVVEPGVDPGDIAPGTATGGELLCVAAVTPHKGHDVLLAALERIRHLPWRCTCVGSLDRDPGFVDHLRKQAQQDRIGERVRFTGPLTGLDLETAYAAADLLVLASRAESFGMVVTEALSRGLPVVATSVGGLPEALGHGLEGGAPGLLVPAEAPTALAEALSGWLGQPDLRRRLRHLAAQRRAGLPDWSTTAGGVSRVLAEMA